MNGGLDCDLLVAGGGINGAAIARDAAGRGLRVVLCEQADLAAHTSSCSTKLIHGGLRYLEFGQIGLVRKALQERQVLLDAAPHLVQPLRLLLVHDATMRPAWMLRAGLWLYDHLGGRSSLPASTRVDLRCHRAAALLREDYRAGFEFSDGWTDDARLVMTIAIDAARRGARILTRTRIARARRAAGLWTATTCGADGAERRIRARALVNATGPWADRFLRQAAGIEPHRRLRLVKGSHVVVRRRLEPGLALMLQAPDRRIAFAIAYERDFMLLGTTDVEFDQDPGQVRIDPDEVDYLCTLANRYLRQPIGRQDIAWSFAGVRPLLDDGAGASAVTRDFALELDRDGAALLNVWGGKITTFRTLAEQAVGQLAPLLGCRKGAWTRTARLPGGDLDAMQDEACRGQGLLQGYVAWLGGRYPWLDPVSLRRMAFAYGTRAVDLLGDAQRPGDLGAHLGGGLHEAELEFLARHEWAMDAQDVLWRRSKLGLHVDAQAAQRVQDWFEQRR
jgi:glycerol-3-phosphate dehydrogenase